MEGVEQPDEERGGVGRGRALEFAVFSPSCCSTSAAAFPATAAAATASTGREPSPRGPLHGHHQLVRADVAPEGPVVPGAPHEVAEPADERRRRRVGVVSRLEEKVAQRAHAQQGLQDSVGEIGPAPQAVEAHYPRDERLPVEGAGPAPVAVEGGDAGRVEARREDGADRVERRVVDLVALLFF